MSLTALAWRSLRARPLRAVAEHARRRPRGRRPVRRARHQRRHRRLGRPHRRATSSGGPTCGSPPSARRGLSPETVAAIAGHAGRRGRRARPSSGGPTSARTSRPADALPPPVTVLGIDPAAEPQLHDLAPGRRRAAARPDRAERPRSPSGSPREDGLTVGLAADDPGRRRPVDLPGDRDPRRRRAARPARSGGPSSCRCGRPRPCSTTPASPGSTSASPPGADAATVVATPSRRASPREPYVLSSPQDLAASPARLDRRLPGDDRADRRDRAVRRRVPDLQHALDDRRRAGPRGRPAAGGRRDPRPGDVASSSSRRSSLGVLGSLLGLGLGAVLAAGDGRATCGRSGRSPLERPAAAARCRRRSRSLVGLGVTLAAALEPARRAGRIQPVEALKARLDLPGRATRPAALAGRRLRRRRRSSASSSWPRGAAAPGSSRRSSSTRVLLVATLLIPFVLPALARLAGPAVRARPPPRGAARPQRRRPRPEPDHADARRR